MTLAREFPGCDELTIKDASSLVSANFQEAQFKCDSCGKGFHPYDDDSKLIVHGFYQLIKNVKVVCQPNEIREAADCDVECRKKYPHCLKYVALIDSNDPPSMENFRCQQCEEGYEPTTDGDFEPWFTGSQRVVCKPKPTDGPKDCTGNCKEDFPNCDQITIRHGENGHSEYECNKCSAGFFPIAYNPKSPGSLKEHDSVMKYKPRIYLCAEKASHMYNNIFKCDRKDYELLDHFECLTQPNCKLVVRVRDLDLGKDYYRCVLCKAGYRPKSTLPHGYDLNQDQCEQQSMVGVDK